MSDQLQQHDGWESVPDTVRKAYVKAWADFNKAVKQQQGQEGNRQFSYANFNDLVAACEDSLRANGFGISGGHKEEKTETQTGTLLFTRATLIHADGVVHGPWIRTVTESNRQGMKALGAAISYARRYSLRLLVGITDIDEEDVERQQSEKKANGHSLRDAHDKQIADLCAIFEEASKKGRKEMVKAWKTADRDLTEEINRLYPDSVTRWREVANNVDQQNANAGS